MGDLGGMRSRHARILRTRARDTYTYTYVMSLRGTSIRPITAGVGGDGLGAAVRQFASPSRDVMSRYPVVADRCSDSHGQVRSRARTRRGSAARYRHKSSHIMVTSTSERTRSALVTLMSSIDLPPQGWVLQKHRAIEGRKIRAHSSTKELGHLKRKREKRRDLGWMSAGRKGFRFPR